MFPNIIQPEERIPFYDLILRNAIDAGGVVTTLSQHARGGAIWLPPDGKNIGLLKAMQLGAYKLPFIFGVTSIYEAYGFRVIYHHTIPGTSIDEWGMARMPEGMTY